MTIERPRWFRAALLFTCLSTTIACKPRGGLGDGPPKIDENTKVLDAFVPAALAEPGSSGLDLAKASTGPGEASPPTPAELPPPAMIEYGPIGDTGEYVDIEVRFNRPVAPLGNHDRLDPKQLGLVIDPPIAGELYFVEPTRLVFSPTDALPVAQQYTVKLDAKLQAIDGPTFEAKASWSFGTTPPSVSMWTNYEGRMTGVEDELHHWKASVSIDTGGEVKLEQLKKHVRAEAIDRDGKATPVAIELRKHKKNRWGYYEYGEFEVRPKTTWPAGSEVVVRVSEKLVGRSGPRPMGHEEAFSFRVAEGVEVNDVGCYQGTFEDGCDLGPILVSFSAPVTRAQAERILVGPATRGFDTLAIDRDYDENGKERNAYWSVIAWGDYQLGAKYRVTIDPELRDVHGQSFVGRDEFEIGFVEPPPELALGASQGTFVQSKSPRTGIESRHAKQLRLRTAVLDDANHERVVAALHAGQPLADIAWPTDGAKLHDERVDPVHKGSFAWASTEVDLGKFTGSKPGAVLFEASIDSLLPGAANRKVPPPKRGLVQITDLGIGVVGSLTQSWVRVANLATDKPIVGAEIELIESAGGKRRVLGKTDVDGLLALPGAAQLPNSAMLRARKGDDQVLVTIGSLHRAGSQAEPLKVGESVKLALTSERKLYKPGEVVRAIGWATVASPYEFSGLRALPPKTMVQLELRDRRNEVVASRTVQAKAHGKFWATLAVPQHAGLGDYTLSAALLGSSSTTTVQVKDFVAPEFEVTAEAAKGDIHHGETTSVSVNARYYFGGTVPITRARESISCSESDYRPPGLEPEWTVAPRRDHWGSARSLPSSLSLPATAERGHLETTFGAHGVDRHRPAHCTYAIAIADATEREVGAEANAWVHPPFYVAAAIPSFIEAKQTLDIPIATLEFDGKPLPVGKVEVSLIRRWNEPEWVDENGEKVFAGWRERTRELPICRTDTKLGNARCSFAKLESGSYTVTIRAEQGNYHPKLEGWLWVPEPDRGWTWSSTPVAHLAVEVDKPNPKPGEIVRARVSAPWSTGKGVLMVAKGGIHELHRFNLEQGSAEFQFTTSDAWIPHTELWAMMVEPGKPGVHPRLVRAGANVDIGNQTRKLTVAVDVPTEARTGESLPIVVHARDAKDQPARGHVSVWAVDEAVLALAPLELPDFVSAFTVAFLGDLGFADGYGALIFPYVVRDDWYSQLEFDPNWTKDREGLIGRMGYGSGSGYGAGGGGTGSGSIGLGGAPMPARSRFASAPIFIGDAELDAQGVAKLSGELPDNLTTFRVTAVVSSPLPNSDVEARFGTGDARVRVTRPVIVRAALPRIMRPGDTAEVGVLVDNLRAGAGEVEVEVALHDAEGVLELLSPPTAKLSIGAGEQVRVPFKVRADKTGTPGFEARAKVRPKQGQPEADAIRLPLPIEPERTLTDRVAVYGTLDSDGAAVLPFELPDDADPAFGGLSVSIGSSLLGGLEDAVAYLVEYPHGCLEQTSSSLLPLIPLGTLAGTYPLGITDTKEYVRAGIARLQTMQLPEGGFAYWPGGREANLYGSAYATWVISRAMQAGYVELVPDEMYGPALQYLATEIEAWSKATAPARGHDIEVALALASLAEIDAAPEAALTKLFERRQGMPFFTKAMLLLAIHDQLPGDPRLETLLGELRSFIDEREAIARVEEHGGYWTWYWDSSTRSSALALMAFLAVDPEHPLVPKLARGLLDSRRGGRWSNTQENAYALVALAEYAAIYEADEPNFEGRIWLDRTAVARVEVQGRSFEFTEGFTGMPALLAADQQDPDSSRLLLERAGVGRMYYRVGLEWASTAVDLPARSEGLAIERELRDMSGVIGDGQAIQTGSLLALDITIDTRSELTHVAIEVPLPAGLEAIDMQLGKGTAAMRISGHEGWWASHQELRRDRAVVFADRVQPGTHQHTVFLRATTPGEYVMPPASAEMMYYPEVYGRSASRRVTVR